MRHRIFLALALSLLAAPGCAKTVTGALKMPEPTAATGDSHDELVVMRDGVKLVTQVYLPEGEGPWPVILIRNPYNFVGGFGPVAKVFTYYGYVGVHQVARGRADSEGEWNPFLNERNDGLDTIEWVKKQPWNNGKIGMFGASYLSMVQWAVADALPPEVKTLVPVVWGNDLRGVAFEGGMFKPEIVTAWAALMHDETLDFTNARNFHKALRHRPQIEIDEQFFGGKKLPWLREWMSSVDGSAPMWRWPDTMLLESMPTRVGVPVLMIGGWYDIFLSSMVVDYHRLATQTQSRLLIGPWTHLTGMDTPPEKPVPGAGDLAANFDKILNWFDHHLKGEPLAQWGPVQTYAIGGDRWVNREAFPPPVRPARLYLQRLAASNACAGGRLLNQPAATVETVSYVYDPADPVPSRGGSGLLAFALPGWGGTPASMRNQAGLCKRGDVLSFVSPPVAADTHLAGTIKVAFTAASDADDTAFTAKVIEVAPDGSTVNIRDAITALRYRNGATTAVAYAPHTPVEVVLEMAPIEWVVKKGYSLRVDLSSSNFPAFAVHTNHAGDWWTQTAVRKAVQTIATAPGRPAYLELPVVR